MNNKNILILSAYYSLIYNYNIQLYLNLSMFTLQSSSGVVLDSTHHQEPTHLSLHSTGSACSVLVFFVQTLRLYLPYDISFCYSNVDVKMEILHVVSVVTMAFLIYKLLDWIIRLPRLAQNTNENYNIVITGCDSGFGGIFAKKMDRPGFKVWQFNCFIRTHQRHCCSFMRLT